MLLEVTSRSLVMLMRSLVVVRALQSSSLGMESVSTGETRFLDETSEIDMEGSWWMSLR